MSNINDGNPKTTEEVSKPFWKNWFVWVAMAGIIAIVIFTIFWGYRILFQVPAEKQAESEIEFKAITPLEGAHLVSYDASYKPVQSFVNAEYLTDIDSVEIFKHYDEQLKHHGWQLQAIKKITFRGNDLGGKSATYCKGEYDAQLYYAGQQAPDRLTYAFSISWGLHNCKQLQGDITPT